MLKVYEETTRWYRGILYDKDDAVLTSANIASLTLTLFEYRTQAIINSRNDYDLYNGGAWDQGCTISDSGVILLRLDPADNEIVSGASENERHVILLKGTTSGSPSYAFVHKYEYEVINIKLIT